MFVVVVAGVLVTDVTHVADTLKVDEILAWCYLVAAEFAVAEIGRSLGPKLRPIASMDCVWLVVDVAV